MTVRRFPSLAALSILAFTTACGLVSNPSENARRYLEQGDAAAARIEASNAVQENPADAEAYVLLGMALSALGEYDTADRTLLKAAELGAQPARVDQLRAPLLLHARAYDRLLKELQPRAGYSGAALATLLTARGKAHLALHHNAQAAQSFDAALKAAPGARQALLGQAQLAYVEGDMAAAAERVERVIAASPSSAEAWLLKAAFAQAQHKTELAIQAVLSGIERNPGYIDLRLAAAELLMHAGRFDQARIHVDYALEHAAKSAAVHHTSGLLHYRQKDFDKALASLREALRLNPDHSPSLLLVAMTYLARGDLNQAEERLRPIAQALPDDAFVRKLYATTLLRMGKGKDAAAMLAEAIEKHPYDAGLLALAGEAHARAHDYARATAYYERAARVKSNDPRLLARLGMMRYAGGDAKAGLTALEAAAALDADHVQADYSMTLLLLQRREYARALEAAIRIQQKRPHNPMGFSLAGSAQLGLRDEAGARRSFERALALDAGYWPAAGNLAQLDLAHGKRDEARKRIEQVLAKNRTSVEAMSALAQITGNRGQFVDSLEMAREADPKALVPRLVLARAYLARHLGARALAVAREAVAIGPDRPEALEILGDAQRSTGSKGEALSTFRKLATLAPQSARAQSRLAEVQAAMRDWTGSESAYKKALALEPHDMDAMAGLARLYASTERFSEAAALAARLKELYPGSPAGATLSGDVLMAQRHYADAAKVYEAAFAAMPSGALLIRRCQALVSAGGKAPLDALEAWSARYPDDVGVRLYFANSLYVAGRYTEAAKHFQAIVTADPYHATALNNLAATYLELKDPRALTTAEAAFALRKDDAEILDTLGAALMQDGNAGRAVELLRKSLARNPDSAEARLHLVAALAHSGERVQARLEAQKLVDAGKSELLDAETKALLQGH
jgi:putative PEP-CTERM system TPR-repeat lipoprotein